MNCSSRVRFAQTASARAIDAEVNYKRQETGYAVKDEHDSKQI